MRTLTLLSLPLVAACVNGPRSEGLAPAENTGGPQIVWDIEARPLPEIPLPNNAATRLDPGSPTGRWVNVSFEAATQYERDVRSEFNRLDGFGSYGAVTVKFSELIDLDDLWQRHNGDGATGPDDFRDDAVYLLNVDPTCRRFGEEVGLEVGRGRNVATLYGHGDRETDELAPDGVRWNTWENTLFPFDVHFDDNNYIYEENQEDLDGDGELDPGEDVDDDGVLDEPNFRDPRACDGLEPDTLAYDVCVADNLMTWYERETNTLILRPLWPLENRCTYAFVVTDRVKGTDGASVMSPFPAINPRDQTKELAPVGELVGRYGLTLDDVAFTWSFTVGSNTLQLAELRKGLYGAGPFARLASEFPVSDLHLWTRAELNGTFGLETDPAVADETLLQGACISGAFAELWDQGLGEWDANMCALEGDLVSIAGWFGGTFRAPNFLVDKDGAATPNYPHDQDETFRIDLMTGDAEYGSTEVTFFCTLPYEDEAADCAPGNPEGKPFCAPFPVVLFAHGYGSSRSEFGLHMGRHTAMGVAACAIDSYGHGLNRWVEDPVAAGALLTSLPRFQRWGATELAGLLVRGRDRDLTNDGLPDGGLDQWSAAIFHTRDMVRQSALEVSQFVRMLRHMDGVTKAADGRLLGDVDGDGDVDLGGPTTTIGHWGISLGGILSAVVAGVEPSIDAASPNAGGASLTEISGRSTQPGLPEMVAMPILGQLVAGCLPTDGRDNPIPVGQGGGDDCWRGRGASDAVWQGGTLRLALVTQNEARWLPLEFGAVEGVQPGDVLLVRNLMNGEEDRVTIHPRGWGRLGIPADALDPVERRSVAGWPDEPGTYDLPDPTAVADALEVVVLRGETEIGRVSTWQRTIEFQGSRYAEGQPLVAVQRGFGYARNSPNLRRMLGFAQHAVSSADPGAWTAHATLEPLDSSYDPFDDGKTPRLLVMPTAGDSTVPAHTGVAMGRASGTLGSWLRDESLGPEVGWRELFAIDPRYGTSKEQFLYDNHVAEGDPRFQRWAGVDFNPEVVFDPDDVSDGAARFSCGVSDWSAIIGENNCPDAYVTGEGEDENFFDVPNPAPGDALRSDRDRGDGTFDAFRIPMLRPGGQHGIYNAQPFRVFDADAYAVNFTARFLVSGGRDVSHESGCDCTASRVADWRRDDEPVFPGQAAQCADGPIDDGPWLKVCDDTCADGWRIRTPVRVDCDPG